MTTALRTRERGGGASSEGVRKPQHPTSEHFESLRGTAGEHFPRILRGFRIDDIDERLCVGAHAFLEPVGN